MNDVRIPAGLAAEAGAHPERFRPEGRSGASALMLAGPVRGMANMVYDGGILSHFVQEDGGITDSVGARSSWMSRGAWALVGSVGDPDSPRPNPGDRVLALDVPGVSAAVGRIGIVLDRPLISMVAVDFGEELPMDTPEGMLGPDTWWGVSRWAILPPAPEDSDPDPLPEKTAADWYSIGQTLYRGPDCVGMIDDPMVAAVIAAVMSRSAATEDQLAILRAAVSTATVHGPWADVNHDETGESNG